VFHVRGADSDRQTVTAKQFMPGMLGGCKCPLRTWCVVFGQGYLSHAYSSWSYIPDCYAHSECVCYTLSQMPWTTV
jgi:hypothetical protein